jgi:vancomycin aglycone glucosyltransferase
MRIVLSPVGGADEVLPMVALGEFLQNNGHPVLICAPEKFRSVIMKHNLRIVSSGASFEQYLESGKQVADRSVLFVRALAAEIPVHFVSMRDALREADLVIGGVFQFAAPSVAEQSGIPYMCAITSPTFADREQFTETGSLSGGGFLSGWNRMQRKRSWKDLLTVINRERKFSGLNPVDDLFRYCTSSGSQILGVDPDLTGLKNTKDSIVTGFWTPPEEPGVADQWESYFAEKTPVAFVGPLDVENIAALCDSISQAGFRPLLSADWVETQNLPPSVSVYPSYSVVPHQVSIAIHQGSSRFTAAAARAGVPQIVVPAVNSQAYWSQRVQAAGIGIEASSAIPESISKIAADPACRDRALLLSQKLRANDSFKPVLDLIEKL